MPLNLTNPNGAFVGVTDYRTFKLADGSPMPTFQVVVDDFQSAGAITAGDLVNLVAPTSATTPPQWKQSAAADSANRLRGVALNGTSAAGQNVRVVIYGLAFVNVGAGTPAADNFAIQSATVAGQATPTAAAPAATDVLGAVVGWFLGAKDANNRAPIFVERA